MEEAQSERTSQSIAQGRSGSRVQQTRRRPGRESRERTPLPDDTLRLRIAGVGEDAAANGDSDIFDTFAR